MMVCEAVLEKAVVEMAGVLYNVVWVYNEIHKCERMKGQRNDTWHCSSSMQSLRRLHGGTALC